MADPAVLELRAQVARVEEKIDRLLALQTPRGSVDVELLVAAIADEVGTGERFTAGGLKMLAASDLSTRARLRTAVAGRNARQIAKLLSPYVGHTIDRWRLERIGTSRPAVLRLCDGDSLESRSAALWRL